jgi:phosphoribosyl 1,2-cyclic phosphodiesterase
VIARFWGVRGSIPAPLTSAEIASKVESAVRRAKDYDFSQEGAVPQFMKELPWPMKATCGGNTPCVEILCDDPHSRIVFDAGTGIRSLGRRLMAEGFSDGNTHTHLFLSHTHWDHIQGFPFFLPAYVPKNRVTIYSSVPDMEARLSNQQQPAYFPVPMKTMGADLEFVLLTEDKTVRIGDSEVFNVALKHPGGSNAFRVAGKEGIVVYASDTEFTNLSDIDVDKYVSFFAQANVLIFDSQYSLSEAMEKEDWGHSPSVRGVDLAHEAGVKTLVMFHHEPTYDDNTLWELVQRTQKYAEMRGLGKDLQVMMAYEGLELDIIGR